MIEHKGISVHCDAGYQVPDAYVKCLTSVTSNVRGAVVRKDPKLPGLMLVHADSGMAPDLFKKINKEFESRRILHFVGNFSEGYLADDIQPFRILQSSSGDIVMAANLVGDFKKHLPTTGESKHSAAFWCASTKLTPRFQQLWRICKEDANAVLEELKLMEKEITDLIGLQGGMITLMLTTPDDTVIRHHVRSMPTFKSFQWGDTSDVLDYVTGIVETKKPDKKPFVVDAVEEEVEEEEVVEEAPIIPSKTNKPKEEAKSPIISDKSGVKSVKEKEVALKSGAVVRLITVGDKQVMLWYPPIMVTKRKNLKPLYQQACGRTPTNQDVDARIGVKLTNEAIIKEVIKSLADVQALDLTGSDAPRTKGADTTGKETVQVKSTTTGQKPVAVVAGNAPQQESRGTSVHEDRSKEYPEGGSPIYSRMTPVQKHAVTKHLKALDKNGMSILNPQLDQELEETTHQFYKDIDYRDIEETLGWRYETRAALAKAAPEAMAIWSGDLLRRIRNLEKDLDQLTDPAVTTQKRKVG